jgi:UDP-N-acetyl-2-amino-2-deoxyglucuronate dehydrogenase
MTLSDIGFGIVGAGMVARYHATAIARTAGARLAAVCRADTARAAEASARFGVPCATSYEALLARPDVDVVCICTPSGQHAAQAIAAALAGKHILVEKPMALTLADADAMIAARRTAGVLLAVALQRRSEPSFHDVRAAIEAGELGRLTLGAVGVPYLRPQSYYDSAAWRGTWALDGGGALMNQGIHLLDLLLWYMGDVAEVQATAATLTHAIEVEDCITATLRFESSALGVVSATTTAAPGFPHRVEIYGDQGGVQIEGEQIVRWESAGEEPTNDVRARYVVAGETREPIAAGAGASPTGIGAAGHTRLIGDLVSAIREGRAPLVPGEEGRRSLALALAIYKAARIGKATRVE